MLKFLRTHQKLFFLLTTAAVVVTFCFFGTYSTLEKTEEKQDRKVAKSIEGRTVMQSEIDVLSYLLALDADSSLYERQGLFFNNNIIEKNFFDNRLAHLLLTRYFDRLEPSLKRSFQQAVRYHIYEHPQQPAISQMKVYEQFYPQMAELIYQLKDEKEFSLKGFELLARLYSAQKTFTPYTLKRLLLFQQSQYPEVKKDPYILQSDMLLFGFRGIKDWFGKDFLDLISQFILNTAEMAERKGFSVKEKEAKEELNLHLFKNLQARQEKPAENLNPPADFYKQQLRLLGIDEKSFLQAWRKILLFQRYLHAVGSSAIIDPVLFGDMADFAEEKITVADYRLPDSLDLQDIEEYFALKIYLKALFGSAELKPARQLKKIKQLEKDAPQLVFTPFKIEIQKIDMDDLLLKIGEKKLWNWQTEKANFSLLQQKFSQLASEEAKKCSSEDQIFHFLESLNPVLRSQIDDFSRRMIVQNNRKMVKEALFLAEKQEKILDLPHKGGEPVLQGIDNSVLLPLLEAAWKKDSQAQQQLSFLKGENVYYCLLAKEKLPAECFTFRQALVKSDLEKDKNAQNDAEIIKLRKQNLSKQKQFLQRWKKAYLVDIRDKIQKGGDENIYICREPTGKKDILEDQFKLKKEILSISRCDKKSPLQEKLFSEEKIGRFSEVQDDLSFFVLLKRENIKDGKRLENMQKKLQNEAILSTAEKILEEIKLKKALVLPVDQIADED